jgi:hypothetical protein
MPGAMKIADWERQMGSKSSGVSMLQLDGDEEPCGDFPMVMITILCLRADSAKGSKKALMSERVRWGC